ncbi:MAG: hypothetical protein HQL08_13015 [Nitrospirae bacterium]|nr:hypothetical protein [Nitrospirota bacterium]
MQQGQSLNVSHMLSAFSSSNQDANFKEFLSERYPFKNDRKVFFAANSGVCNLRCAYCLTNRPTGNPSLTKDDFSFIFEKFGENIYFILSGRGDFFVSYPREERLLSFLLQHNVNLFLCINAVEIGELGEHNLAGREKVCKLEISFHYAAMKERKLLKQWTSNIATLKKEGYNFFVKMVFSLNQENIWEEAINFYKKEIYPITGQRLFMTTDSLSLQTPELTTAVQCLTKKYTDSVMIREPERTTVKQPLSACAAGSRYFRVLFNGDIVPCEAFQYHTSFRLGNTRKKKLVTFTRDVLCEISDYCDCGYSSSVLYGLKDESGNRYKNRIIYIFESEQVYMQLPEPTDGNVIYYIDVLQQDSSGLTISGWAFLTGMGAEGSSICIVMKEEAREYVFSTLKIYRNDVTVHFNNGCNLNESGFRANIPKKLLPKVSYKIGLFVSSNGTTALHYAESVITPM